MQADLYNGRKTVVMVVVVFLLPVVALIYYAFLHPVVLSWVDILYVPVRSFWI